MGRTMIFGLIQNISKNSGISGLMGDKVVRVQYRDYIHQVPTMFVCGDAGSDDYRGHQSPYPKTAHLYNSLSQRTTERKAASIYTQHLAVVITYNDVTMVTWANRFPVYGVSSRRLRMKMPIV